VCVHKNSSDRNQNQKYSDSNNIWAYENVLEKDLEK
jgi:hypothetical protein